MRGIAVWRDGAADGPTNMAADECLAAAAVDHGGLVIRLYRWETTTVSLGAFQPIAAARACEAIAGIPVVRRPSGGGALVHGSDFTYAVAVPKRHVWGATPQSLYDAMHTAMIDALAAWGIKAQLATPHSEADKSFFCFERRAQGDVVTMHPSFKGVGGDIKLMGSAQRRLADAVVQHGSLLLNSNADVDPTVRHVGLADVAVSRGIDPGQFPDWGAELIRGIAKTLGQQVEEQGSFLEACPRGLQARRERYAAASWINRR